jgi:FkbM family methyltransferase
MSITRTTKNLLKKTPLYALRQRILRHREARRFWQYTAEDEERAAFYQQFINRGDLVFDVGANVGNRTKVFHKLGGRVVAFEPQTACYKLLKEACASVDGVRVVQRALSKMEGEAELRMTEVNTVSTLSTGWIEAVQKSGRFSDYHWNRTERVVTTTLDAAIREYGVPSFIKIDVEGFEFEVLSGLSMPIKCISIEHTPEYIGNTLKCIEHLAALGPLEAQLSFGESLKFVLPAWSSLDELKRMLADPNAQRYGDIYLRRPEQG